MFLDTQICCVIRYKIALWCCMTAVFLNSPLPERKNLHNSGDICSIILRMKMFLSAAALSLHSVCQRGGGVPHLFRGDVAILVWSVVSGTRRSIPTSCETFKDKTAAVFTGELGLYLIYWDFSLLKQKSHQHNTWPSLNHGDLSAWKWDSVVDHLPLELSTKATKTMNNIFPLLAGKYKVWSTINS